MHSQPFPPTPLAAVVYAPDDPIERLLSTFARQLKSTGVIVGGVLQHDTVVGGEVVRMELEDLLSGARWPLSHPLTPHGGSAADSAACQLDLAALAAASGPVLTALQHDVALMIVNKFGTQEVAGGGLRAEMGQVVSAGVPLLTAVGKRFLAEWQVFCGDHSVLLPPDLNALHAWWSSVQHAGQTD